MKNIIILILLTLAGSAAHATDPAAGKSVFTTRCTACHAIHDKLVGPALKDTDKRHDSDWLKSFIRSSQSMVKSGDATAIQLFEANNKVIMPDHNDLSDADISNIIAFIRDEGSRPLEAAIRPPVIKSGEKPISFFDVREWVIFTTSVMFLYLILFVIVTGRSATPNS